MTDPLTLQQLTDRIIVLESLVHAIMDKLESVALPQPINIAGFTEVPLEHPEEKCLP